MRFPTSGRIAVAFGLSGLALAGCGVAGDEAPQSSLPQPTKFTAEERAGHNDIDVDFAQMMLVHTRQSVELAELAQDRSDQPEVVALAGQLAGEDANTIAKMTELLESWGADVPDEIVLTDMDHSHMDHEGIGMGFMAGITDDQVTLLTSLDGAAFDKMFLKDMLIHRGAGVAMVQSERIYGQSGDANKLAKTLETSQGAEMQTIQDLRH
jgi:uncharacterized protein (DUF305 family)